MLTLLLFLAASCNGDKHPDIATVKADLLLPPVTKGAPMPGRRVRLKAPGYENTNIAHLLYLPTDWVKGSRYPVIVEYPGNGTIQNAYGDRCTGRPEGAKLGFGISGGRGFLWLCLPIINTKGTDVQLQWWGNLGKTVEYCKTVVPQVCKRYGGDPRKVFLAGFSRGAIACNYIGLHDDEIAGLWCGFVCHSHYDGVRSWGTAGSEQSAATARLRRLGLRPQWISHEGSIDETEQYLADVNTRGAFTLRTLPYRNHTDAWVLRDIPLRRELRTWVGSVLLHR